MILCTEIDKEFIKYKDKVKNRKAIFTIKPIFTDWWKNFLETYPNLNIRGTVFTNVEKIHVFKFISRLIIHIPDYDFKQIRFFCAYHNSTKITITVATLLSK